MIPEIEIYRWLKRYGYLPNVRLNELYQLDSNSKELRSGVEKMQAFYGHQTLGQPDSVVGPKTLSAMLQPRCGHPDFADEELAKTAPVKEYKKYLDMENEEDLRIVWESHNRLKVGRGSWPQPCQKQGVKIYVDRRQAPSNLDVDRLIEVNFRAYAQLGLKMELVDSKSDGHIDVEWRVLKGSVIGLAEFNNQTCEDSVFCYLDPGFNPSFVMVARLLQHELGHNCNLQHTQGGVMNPSIIRVNEFNGWHSNDPSYDILVRYFGGEPVDPEPGPNPGPNPVPNEFSGVIMGGGNLYRVAMNKI